MNKLELAGRMKDITQDVDDRYNGLQAEFGWTRGLVRLLRETIEHGETALANKVVDLLLYLAHFKFHLFQVETRARLESLKHSLAVVDSDDDDDDERKEDEAEIPYELTRTRK